MALADAVHAVRSGAERKVAVKDVEMLTLEGGARTVKPGDVTSRSPTKAVHRSRPSTSERCSVARFPASDHEGKLLCVWADSYDPSVYMTFTSVRLRPPRRGDPCAAPLRLERGRRARWRAGAHTRPLFQLNLSAVYGTGGVRKGLCSPC